MSIDGFGSVTWWGFSPAMNLVSLYEQGKLRMCNVESNVQSDALSDCINVLLVGSGDLRHMMITVALAFNHTSKAIHFYVIESCLEVLARHMLFLSLLFEPPDVFGLQEKTELFLELYGNSMIRAHTSEYLKVKATDLIKMITDENYLKSTLPLLDTSALKFKEKDFLEGIFKFWRCHDEKSFSISDHWESRLRHHLGVRHDSRSGVYDWDYHMKLHEMAPSITCREYCEWRETGLAFHIREDAPYVTPNRTLASGILLTHNGEKVARRGYWGDIVNSPYLSFGIHSENMEILKSENRKHVYSGADISNYNVTSFIHKLTTGEEYSLLRNTSKDCPKVGQRSSQIQELGSIKEMTIEKVDLEETSGSQEEADGKGDIECRSNDKGEVKLSRHSSDSKTTSTLRGPLFNGACYVSFLPLGSVSELSKKGKYKKLFNIAYFSNSMVHYLKSGIEAIFAPDCTLVIETTRFMVDLRNEQRIQYDSKVTSMAESLGFKVSLDINSDPKSAHLAFTRSS